MKLVLALLPILALCLSMLYLAEVFPEMSLLALPFNAWLLGRLAHWGFRLL